MLYDSYDVWWWPFVYITLAGILPTAIWRWSGVVAVGNLDETSQWLVLVRCLSTSLVAAVIAQFVFFPSGALAMYPLWIRFGAACGGFVAFLLAGRRVIIGVIAGEVLLLVGMLASGNL